MQSTAQSKMQSSRAASQLSLPPQPAARDTGRDPASRGGFAARSERRVGPTARRTTSCPVCRCDSVRVDEVEAAGRLHLAECPRCEHRWTSRAAIARTPAARGRVAFVHAARLDAAAQA